MTSAELREEILDRLISLIETYKMHEYKPYLAGLIHRFEVSEAMNFIKCLFIDKELFMPTLCSAIEICYREMNGLFTIGETEV